MYDSKILQIIPADNWYGVYWSPEEPYYFLCPIACFALVETPDEDRTVVGMDAADGLDFAEEQRNFGHYVRQDQINDEIRAEWSEEGRKRASRTSPSQGSSSSRREIS
jgi:hypothetical protein